MMKIGSLFSGIGGLELGLERSGLGETVWQVEQSEFCRAVLAKHWPNAKRFDDVCTVGGKNLDPVDIICGGFPCQDVSSAGKGAGLAGSRSGLWYEYLRIVCELRPQWVVIENVASGAARWVDSVRGDLERIGYATIPVPMSAADVGAPHLRARVFIIASDANSKRVRLQPRRSKWPNGENSLLGAGACEAGVIGNANSDGQPSGSSPTWPAPPSIPGVDDGVPNRLDRNRALGNAVVPQCAEVIGWMIRELVES